MKDDYSVRINRIRNLNEWRNQMQSVLAYIKSGKRPDLKFYNGIELSNENQIEEIFKLIMPILQRDILKAENELDLSLSLIKNDDKL